MTDRSARILYLYPFVRSDRIAGHSSITMSARYVHALGPRFIKRYFRSKGPLKKYSHLLRRTRKLLSEPGPSELFFASSVLPVAFARLG